MINDSKIIHEVERRLAEELLEYLEMDDSVTLRWNDTTLHLVEAIHYLYISDMMRDENGMNMTKKDIADRAFRRFNVQKPRNMSTYLTRIRNIKGKKMQTLLDINLYKMNRYSIYEGIARCVDEEVRIIRHT